MIKNIIFDLDGTLANTSTDIIFSLNHALKRANISKKVNFKTFKKIANRGSLFMIQNFLKKNNRSIKIINNYFLSHYKFNMCRKTQLKKNVLNFIKKCKKKNIQLFVSTNKSKKNAVLILKKLKILKFFKFIAGSDSFKYQKPNPLHLEALRRKFGIKKKQTVFIGDTEIDSALAYSFNIKFVLIKNGYTTLKFSEIKSDITIANYSNLSRIFRELSKLT